MLLYFSLLVTLFAHVLLQGSHVSHVQSISEYLWATSSRRQQPEHLSITVDILQQKRPDAADICTDYQVPLQVIDRYAEVIDVVTADSRSCNCFTKAYGKLARGAGSLLATVDPSSVDSRWRLVGGQGSLFYQRYANVPEYWKDDSSAGQPGATQCHSHLESQVPGQSNSHPGDVGCDTASVQPCLAQLPDAEGDHKTACTKEDLAHAWHKLKLRYFSPLEIAKLHSFPSDFSFPADLSARQCYKLLGNSLSVVVVADLLNYLMAPEWDRGDISSQ